MSDFNFRDLEKCFAQDAIKSSFEGFYSCLGLITAVASSPEKIEPVEWIEQIKLTKDSPSQFADAKQAKDFSLQLASWWRFCLSQFDLGQPLGLPAKLAITPGGKANKALNEFATGYLKGYDWLSATWQNLMPEEDSEAKRSLMLLNLILLRFINEKGAARAHPEIFAQLPDINGCLTAMPSLVSAVGMLGVDLSHKLEELPAKPEPSNPQLNPLKSVGRNDLCPCGSGKKFKKCCLH